MNGGIEPIIEALEKAEGGEEAMAELRNRADFASISGHMTIQDVQELYDAGVHFGYPRARRHPTAAPFLFGTRDRTDIFDLEETKKRLETARAFVSSLAQSGKAFLFVGGKNEAQALLKGAAERAGMPYVAGRWIGGTLTNFKNIRKRIELLQKLMGERESGRTREVHEARTPHDRPRDRRIARALRRLGQHV